MTFTEFKNLPISSKIALCEFSVPAGPSNFDICLNYEPGIWQIVITPGIVTVDGSDEDGTYTNQNVSIYNDIIGLIVNSTIEYNKVFSLAELRLQNKGFFYDKIGTYHADAAPNLMIHFDNFEEPLNKTIQLKQVFGFCTKGDEDSSTGVYFNGTYYQPLITSIPSISKSKDPLFYGLMRFQGGNVVLNNSNKFFDNFRDYELFRTPAVVKFGFSGLLYENFYSAFKGYVESYNWNHNEFTTKLQDKRKGLTEKIPHNIFTVAEFPFIDTQIINTPMPIGFGNVNNAPLIRVNTNEPAATHWQYHLSDTEFANIYSVTTVECNGAVLSPAVYTVNSTTGILSVNVAAVEDNEDDVSCSFCPRNIYNSHELAKTLLLDFGDVVFNDTNFFTAEWNRALVDARDVQIYITEKTDIKSLLEKCADASDAIIFPRDDGRYTSRIYDNDRAVNRTIENDEWIDLPTISLDESQFLSSITIKYDQDWKKGDFKTYLNNTYEAETKLKYKGERENAKESFETILATETGAIAKSESIMFFSKDINEIVKRKTKTQNIDLEIMDFIKCMPMSRDVNETITQIWEILGITKNLSNAEIELTLRYVKNFIPVEPSFYQPGVFWGEELWGQGMYEVTHG